MNAWHDVKVKDMRWLFCSLILYQNTRYVWKSWTSSNTRSIAIFAILLHNTLERTHKRNTKRRLQLA